MRKRVLILCTGNSCRSQMAEVLWRDLGGNRWECHSAGSHPAGFVHPMAIQVLNELELDTQHLRSKSMNEFCAAQIELVVSVCDNAKESCPAFVGETEHLHWPFEDPAQCVGDEPTVLNEFRRIRDEIRQKIAEYLQDNSPISVE